MSICTSCYRESAGEFAFCPYCGAALAESAPPREQRKTVTVLFCDVTGSTALGEAADPEALRALLARFFERMKTIVESHGGTVEKFVGDAVMAVFGVPAVHEDDALRAVRAADEMRAALPEVGVQARIGINTGEVVTGTAERLATGDAVNVAARLEQAAQPGEVLLGAETLRLVREAVDAEPVAPLALKGKTEPVRAYRLVAVRAVGERRAATPMVGRDTELSRLRAAFDQAVRDRTCQLFTVLGPAGVGKSRLAAEFLARIDARVVRGRCLSYGEGITYWPVVEILKQLDALPTDAAAAAPLRTLLGEIDAGTSAEQIAWGFRKLLEEQAGEQPLVCVLDDIHWGEPTFLDLVEHVADLSRDAPVLLLCLARPELLDRRPAWGGGKWNATTVLLEPLDAEESERLLAALGTPSDVRARITEAAEGNPLFLEQMLALVRELGNGEVAVPPTIQALLAARLDQLDPAERSVLERGAVEGRVFHSSAVEALSDGEPQLALRLVALVRKELVRPDPPMLPEDDAYRFRHQLIRDAAYEALSKAARAELHERFAAWLEERAPHLVELEEILGHHLEQAARYGAELGRPDVKLAERAGDRLAAAGRRALWRGDRPAAEVLLERALALLRPIRFDVHLELDLAEALSSEPRRAAAAAAAAAERARAEGDRTAEALARLAVASHEMHVSAAASDLQLLAEAVTPRLEAAGDHAGLVHVWFALAEAANHRGRNEQWAEASVRALHHARLAGQQPTHVFGLAGALVYGPRPADEALDELDAALPETPNPFELLMRAILLAMLGRFQEAHAVAEEASARYGGLVGDDRAGEGKLGEIAIITGDHDRAVSHLGRHCELLSETGRVAELSTMAPWRGRSLCVLGRHEEAEPLAQLGRELGDERDVTTQAAWRQVQALVSSHRGEHDDAEQLAREAVAIAEETDAVSLQAAALCDLGEVLAAAGRTDEAAAAFSEALKRYERKNAVALAAPVRDRLAALTVTTSRSPPHHP